MSTNIDYQCNVSLIPLTYLVAFNILNTINGIVLLMVIYSYIRIKQFRRIPGDLLCI